MLIGLHERRAAACTLTGLRDQGAACRYTTYTDELAGWRRPPTTCSLRSTPTTPGLWQQHCGC